VWRDDVCHVRPVDEIKSQPAFCNVAMIMMMIMMMMMMVVVVVIGRGNGNKPRF